MFWFDSFRISKEAIDSLLQRFSTGVPGWIRLRIDAPQHNLWQFGLFCWQFGVRSGEQTDNRRRFNPLFYFLLFLAYIFERYYIHRKAIGHWLFWKSFSLNILWRLFRTPEYSTVLKEGQKRTKTYLQKIETNSITECLICFYIALPL